MLLLWWPRKQAVYASPVSSYVCFAPEAFFCYTIPTSHCITFQWTPSQEVLNSCVLSLQLHPDFLGGSCSLLKGPVSNSLPLGFLQPVVLSRFPTVLETAGEMVLYCSWPQTGQNMLLFGWFVASVWRAGLAAVLLVLCPDFEYGCSRINVFAPKPCRGNGTF